MDKQEKVITVVSVALLVLAAVIVVIVWGAYSNWFQTGFEHIYLKADQRLQQDNVYNIGNAKIAVRQFGFKTGYNVKIIAAADEDFLYTVDGEWKEYSQHIAGKDVTKLFNIQTSKRSFVMHARDISLDDVFAILYPGSTVQLVGDGIVMKYKMIVSDASNLHSFELTFLSVTSITDIEVYPDNTIF